MNILISNDDGIAANGIRVLTEELSKNHNVYVIAPDRERSAAGHSLTFHTPLRVEEIEETNTGAKRTWVTTGTPGDCIKIGVNAILSEDGSGHCCFKIRNGVLQSSVPCPSVKTRLLL